MSSYKDKRYNKISKDEPNNKDNFIISCICDNKSKQDIMVQCKDCKSWLHGICINILDNKSIPSKYSCKKCTEPPADIIPKAQNNSKKASNNINTKSSLPLRTRLDESSNDGIKDDKKEFRTKRGRIVNKIDYNKSNSEDNQEKNRKFNDAGKKNKKVNNKSNEEENQVKGKQLKNNIKQTKVQVEATEGSNKKAKTTKKANSDPKINLIISSPNTTEFMQEQLNKNFGISIEDEEINSIKEIIKLPPSNNKLPNILERGPSPPPRIRNSTAKSSFKDMLKKVDFMKDYIQRYQSQLNRLTQEQIQTNFSTSNSLATKLSTDLDEFLFKFSKFSDH